MNVMSKVSLKFEDPFNDTKNTKRFLDKLKNSAGAVGRLCVIYFKKKFTDFSSLTPISEL